MTLNNSRRDRAVDPTIDATQEGLVIGITGEICSGKDTLARFVAQTLKQEEYSVLVVRTSDILREVFGLVGINPNRLDFHNLTQFLRGHYGEDILSRIMMRRLHHEAAQVILWVGLRSPHDLEALSKLPHSALVFVEASPEERFGRILQRNENPDDQEKTWEEFLQDCERSTERTIRSFRSKADLVINNPNAGLQDSQKKLLDEIRKRLPRTFP